MRAEVFFPRMIRNVIAIGVARAFLGVGEDVMDPAADETRIASADDATDEAPLVDPSALVPPTNGTQETGDARSAALLVAALP